MLAVSSLTQLLWLYLLSLVPSFFGVLMGVAGLAGLTPSRPAVRTAQLTTRAKTARGRGFATRWHHRRNSETLA